jgi:hypothetical protein
MANAMAPATITPNPKEVGSAVMLLIAAAKHQIYRFQDSLNKLGGFD